jgi:U6 snRNA-associated Sm-like protein LSm8
MTKKRRCVAAGAAESLARGWPSSSSASQSKPRIPPPTSCHRLPRARTSMSEWLQTLVDQRVSVITNDGVHVLGVLKGVDKVTNLVLVDAEERVYSKDKPVQVVALGVYLLRGDNCAAIGTENPEVLVDLNSIRALPMKPLKH